MFSTSGMAGIGSKVKELNQNQINAKKEATGKSVKPYEREYAKRKGVSPKNVTYIGYKRTYSKKQRAGGHMMQAFKVKAKPREVEIGFFDKASQDKAKWNTKHRTFIGLTIGNYNKLLSWIYKIFKK